MARVSRARGVDGPGRDGCVAMVSDVTRERAIETLERDFVSLVTHELKTPLTVIEGYTSLLASGRAGPLDEVQRRYVAKIADQGRVLRRLIQDILDTARLERGALELQPQAVDAAGLVTDLGGAFAERAAARGLAFSVDAAALSGVRLRADPDRCRQILGNLLDNALKFTPSGGEVRLLGRATAGTVEIEVRDTGPGIPLRRNT